MIHAPLGPTGRDPPGRRGLACSCGTRETPPGPVAGQPKHDQAVYARETPTSAAPDFLAADLDRVREADGPARVHPPPPSAARRAGQDGQLLVLRRDVPPRIRAEASGQGRGQALRDVHRLLGVRREGPPLHPGKGELLPPRGLRARTWPWSASSSTVSSGPPTTPGSSTEERPTTTIRSSANSATSLNALAAKNDWDEGPGPGRRPGHPRQAHRPPARPDHRRGTVPDPARIPGLARARPGRLCRLRQLHVPPLLRQGRVQGPGQLEPQPGLPQPAALRVFPGPPPGPAQGLLGRFGRGLLRARLSRRGRRGHGADLRHSLEPISTNPAGNTGSRTARRRTTTPSTASATSSPARATGS